jgi:hypothetical protein
MTDDQMPRRAVIGWMIGWTLGAVLWAAIVLGADAMGWL